MNSNEQSSEYTDISANQGPEQKVTTITFKDLIERLIKIYPPLPSIARKQLMEKAGDKPGTCYIDYNFGVEKGEQGNIEPVLVASFDPPLFAGRAGEIRYQYYSVNSAHIGKIYWDEKTKKELQRHPYPLTVNNVPFSKFGDPEYIEKISVIKPEAVLVAETSSQAIQIGGWLADPKIKELVNEYAKIDQYTIEKYSQLRAAPYITESMPGWGVLTYADIKDQAKEYEETIKSKKPDYKPQPFTITPSDLEWLHLYMKNKDFPIPK